MSKISKIFKNNDCYASMFVEFDNGIRLEVRLFNECSADIMLTAIKKQSRRIIVIGGDTNFTDIESELIGLEFNTDLLIERTRKSHGGFNKKGKGYFTDLKHPTTWTTKKIEFKYPQNKEIEFLVDSIFKLAWKECIRAINEHTR